jgi:hypothetical protein
MVIILRYCLVAPLELRHFITASVQFVVG